MKAAQTSEVPWAKSQLLVAGSNPLLAIIFIVFVSFVLVFLYRFNKII
jgi:hypothetical protein